MQKIVLQREDFSDFSIGNFPYDSEHSAMGEYHFYPPKGYRGNWYCPITDYGLRGPMWMVTKGEGKKVMENTLLRMEEKRKRWNILTTGDAYWDNYTVECGIQVLNTSMLAGLAVRYQNSRCFYAICLEAGKLKLIKRNHEEYSELASVEYDYNGDTEYSFKIECDGSRISCFSDGVLKITASDTTYPSGRIALCANGPARFSGIEVYTDKAVCDALCARKQQDEAKVEELRKEYPQPKLWKKINLDRFGAGRSVRFGDLTGDGKHDIVIAQCQKRVFKDCYGDISCLTAINLDGEILWQIGEPNPDHSFITADLPLQIYDIDGDGKNEVVIARDFKIMILEGSTGKVKKWIHTPKSETPIERLYSGVPFGRYAFDRVNIDCIRICNFSGKDKPSDILVKDRYSRLWAYDCDLNPLWNFNDGITGHFSFARDVNGDGRDELFVGYNLIDSYGKKIWKLPVPTDHTDEIIIGRLDPESEGEVICTASGDEGFIMADLQGNIIKKEMIGHAQRISAGNYRPELPGFEIAVTTFWFNQGIFFLYNCKGELLQSFEPGSDGNIIAPVNWTGDGRDLILLNGNVKFGGLMDGYGRRVVVFPDDGHPDLCCEVLSLMGDCRDEVVLWDNKEMWIYTQDREFKGDKIYCPEKYPDYNASNYRGEYSWPRWIEKN